MDNNSYNGELYKKLIEYVGQDYYPFHMPGHKRNSEVMDMMNPYSFDITEIEGFDNLHEPCDLILNELRHATKLYGSKSSFFIVNGSTTGNLAAIASVTKPYDKIIIGRNCHKSVYNAIELLNLKAEYIYPKYISEYDVFGEYELAQIESAIEKNHDAKAIVLTSPTYEGIVSDIAKICEIAHKNNIPVIVDEAHGAHFVLSDEFPQNAIKCKADIIIESLHKTLPSLTQTAILHYNSEIINIDILKKKLATFQSSSPSYVLMASMSNCMAYIDNVGSEEITNYIEMIRNLADRAKNFKNIKILTKYDFECFDFDISKLVIFCNKISGVQMQAILRERYHLEMEMAGPNYVLAMTSIMDEEDAFTRLERALKEIDSELEDEKCKIENNLENDIGTIYSCITKKVCEIYEVEDYIKETNMNDVSREYIYMYPPGIPIVVPGEVVDEGVIDTLKKYAEKGFNVSGI